MNEDNMIKDKTEEIVEIDTGVRGATPDDVLKVSKTALAEINKAIESSDVGEDFKLRVGVVGGGCSGIKFALGFDDQIREDDRILEADSTELLIDSKSIFYLMGVTIDFVDGPQGSGFIFKNPNNLNTCGCNH